MKTFVAAAVAALLLVSPALAQTDPTAAAPAATTPAADPGPNCSGFAAAPALPDGAAATRDQMTAGEQQYQSWGQERVAKLQTCRNDVFALRAQLAAMENAYNTGSAELRTITEAWQADVAEFNARPASRRSRN